MNRENVRNPILVYGRCCAAQVGEGDTFIINLSHTKLMLRFGVKNQWREISQ